MNLPGLGPLGWTRGETWPSYLRTRLRRGSTLVLPSVLTISRWASVGSSFADFRSNPLCAAHLLASVPILCPRGWIPFKFGLTRRTFVGVVLDPESSRCLLCVHDRMVTPWREHGLLTVNPRIRDEPACRLTRLLVKVPEIRCQRRYSTRTIPVNG